MQTDPQDGLETVNKDYLSRWTHLYKILDRRGPFADPSFTPDHGDVLGSSFIFLHVFSR